MQRRGQRLGRPRRRQDASVLGPSTPGPNPNRNRRVKPWAGQRSCSPLVRCAGGSTR